MAAIENLLPSAERELVISRLFDAPPELVFRLWTDPVHALRWWGPRDYPLTKIEMDVRPGGAWRGCLTSVEDGRELWQSGRLLEIEPPRRLVFTFAWENNDELGPETIVTIEFAREAGKTRMSFRQSPFQSAANRDGHGGGWSSAFDRLDDLLAAMQRAGG